MRYFWLRFFLLLFFTKYLKITIGAEAPINEKAHKSSSTSLIKKGNVDIERLSYAVEIVNSSFEANYLLELTFINLAKVLEAMLRLLIIYKNDFTNDLIFLNGCIQSMILNSMLERSDELVSKAKENLLLDFSKSNNELLSKLIEMREHFSPSYFEFLAANQDEITQLADELMTKLNILLSFEANEGFAQLIFSILDLGTFVIASFNNYSNKYINSSRRERSKQYVSSRQNFVLFVPNYKSPFMKLSQISLEKSEENKELASKFVNCLNSENPSEELDKTDILRGYFLFHDYFECKDLTEAQIFKIEMLVLTAINNLRALSFMVYMFGEDSKSWSTDIEKCNLEILDMISARGTPLRVEESVAQEIKLQVRELLGNSEIQSNNMVKEAFIRSLEKDEIYTKSMNLYTILLKSLLLLKNEKENVSSSNYLTKMLDLAINLLEPSIKRCLTRIRFNKDNLSTQEMKLNQSTKFRQRVKEEVEKEKKNRLRMLGLYRKEREEMEKRKKQKEEKERKENREARRKLKEEKAGNKKPKKERTFPTVSESFEVACSNNEELTEQSKKIKSRSKSRSRSRSTSPGGHLKFNSSKSKSERRREKLEKLLQEEAKSIQKEQIRQTKQMEKTRYEAPKKRKQGERKTKNENQREKEEKEREEERERERIKEKERQENIQHSNFMYSLLSSVESIEGLYRESEKSLGSLQGLISFVFSAMLEDIESEEKAEEDLANSMAAASISEQDHASSSQVGAESATKCEDSNFQIYPKGHAGISLTDSEDLSLKMSSNIEISARRSSRTRQKSESTHTNRSKSRSNSRSRSRRVSRSNSRTRSRRVSRSSSRTRSRRVSRSNSRPRKTSSPTDTSPIKTEVSFDGFTVPYLSDFDPQNEPNLNSRFFKFFSPSGSSNSGSTALSQSKLDNFGLNIQDFSIISESSSIEEIQDSLEKCGNAIQMLHLEIAPSLEGRDFFEAKLLERELIKIFTHQLILLQKKNS
ncbi:putative secreted signal peptide-containing protein [Cryptosporidium parvum]